jgi:hypothetical protein
MSPNIRRAPVLVCVLAALAAVAPACGSGASDPAPPGERSTPAPSAAGGLAAFVLTLPQRTPEDAAARAGAVAGVLTGRRIERPSLAPLEAELKRGPRSASARLADAPRVTVGHHPRVDAVWAIDEDVAHDVATPTDVGVEAAAVTFRRTVADLDRAQVVDSATLDVAGTRVSHIVQGSGRSGGAAPVERVKEYVFFAPRTINGIPIANAGVRVSVHRSGRVASIRVEGPAVDEVRDQDGLSTPVGSGHAIARTVAEADLDTRVLAENPDAEISPLGLVYWMPSGASTAVVAPRQGYVIYPQVEIAGRTGPGRGHRILYAVDDAAAEPVVAPSPASSADGEPAK